MMIINSEQAKTMSQGNAQALFLPSYSIVPLLYDLLHAISFRLDIGQTGGVQC